MRFDATSLCIRQSIQRTAQPLVLICQNKTQFRRRLKYTYSTFNTISGIQRIYLVALHATTIYSFIPLACTKLRSNFV